MPSTHAIPPILHQTWKTQQLPSDLERLRQTWLERHPTWTYRLWTDEDNRAFVAEHYAWFLPTYDGYAENIKRADAIRYFIIYHFGGVYVDLDFECFRPMGDLLQGREVVIGLEPPAHVETPGIRALGFDHVLCNAWLASRPGHPFWEHVFDSLTAHRDAPGVLDATGPFLLSRAYQSYTNREAISLALADLLYPAGWRETWRSQGDLDSLRERVSQTAYAMHYWHGVWRREEVLQLVRQRLRSR